MFRSKTELTSRALAIAVLLASLLAGCSDLYFDRRDTIALSAGDAIAANAAEQTINPWPRNSGNNHLTFNGQRMQHAVECYRYNKVAPPADMDPTVDAAALVPPPPPSTCDSFLSTNKSADQPAASSAGSVLGSAFSGGSSANR
jgi:hypothetical protein